MRRLGRFSRSAGDEGARLVGKAGGVAARIVERDAESWHGVSRRAPPAARILVPSQVGAVAAFAPIPERTGLARVSRGAPTEGALTTLPGCGRSGVAYRDDARCSGMPGHWRR